MAGVAFTANLFLISINVISYNTIIATTSLSVSDKMTEYNTTRHVNVNKPCSSLIGRGARIQNATAQTVK